MSFPNPVWDALQTKHRHFAVSNGEACRYPAEVAPFVAVGKRDRPALHQLAALLAPGEKVWLIGDSFPAVEELSFSATLKCLQMVLPGNVTPPARRPEIVPLSDADAPDMVALTDLAFPGFFRKRTCEMGKYYGVCSEGQLIAMGGERLLLDGYSEISGVCTHPAHRGQGFGTALIWELAETHRKNGLASFLHVLDTNHGAINLYRHMGFQDAGTVILHQVSLPAS